jgi:hypothetical protein
MRWMRAPPAFALVAVAAYLLLVLPTLVQHDFDPSVFIVAGDRFVDRTQSISPIMVRHNKSGYDGQFYYRLALAPYRMQQSAFGIRLDEPAWRAQRILYSVLAWGGAFGQAALVPASLLLVNLLGLGSIAVFTVRLTARLHLPPLTPLAMMLWPGFIIALTHDTTEIVAAALLLGALDAYFAERLLAYGLLGALATLTRETSILALGGVLCFETFRPHVGVGTGGRWPRVLVCGLALIPFLMWREAQLVFWHHSPQGAVAANNLGWPFVGAVSMMRDALSGVRQYTPSHGLDVAMRGYVLASSALLLWFCAVAASRVPYVVRTAGVGALAAGWLPIMVLMSLLTEAGPWTEPTGYFRAFTECYVVGCLLVALRPPSVWVSKMMFAGCAVACVGAWAIAVVQVR